MTAQVIATPPGTATVYQSGARIPAEAGVAYSIADVDPNGAVGPVLDPLALVREVEGEDLLMTLPDGTVLVFEGIIPLLALGEVSIAGPDGEAAIASIESAVAPAAGPDGGGDGDGSSSAFNPFSEVGLRNFGEAPEGPFIGLGLPAFDVREEDENILLVGEDEVVEVVQPDVPETPDPSNDIVITADDGTIIVNGRALLANDNGVDLKILEVGNYTGNGTVTLNAAGDVVIETVADDPNLDNSGLTETFTYTVCDANGQTATATVLVYVDEFRFLDGFVGAPPPPPGDLGNFESEIFITLDPSPNQNQPPEVQTIVGGPGDDIFQLRDEQNTNPFGGEGFDTLFADTEFSSDFMEFDLPDVFSQANNSIERIQAADEVSSNGIVRLTPQFISSSAVDWDFTDIELLGIDEIRGSLKADTIVGSAGDDTILGNNGNDTLSGGAGDDFIDGGNDADTIDGGADNDTLIGGGGQDSISGGSGNDEIDGGSSSDSISGGAGDDTISAGGGNDRVDGNAGNDIIDLGDDNSNSDRVFISDVDDGLDTIDNFDNIGGSTTSDVLDLDALFDDLEVDIELGPGGLSTADRIGRVSLVQDGADTNVFIDTSAAGDGSALVQIATILDTDAGFFQIGNNAADDVFVGA